MSSLNRQSVTLSSSPSGGVDPESPRATATSTTKQISAEDCIKNSKFYGHLNKMGDIVKTWKKRVFVLVGHKLFYYKSLKDKKFKGVIDVKNVPVSRADNELKKKFVIKLETPKRTYWMVASSEKDCSTWLLHLTDASGESIVVRQMSTTQLPAYATEKVFSTIQDAIEYAKEGEKIMIHPGIYREHLVISKPVQLIGHDVEEATSGEHTDLDNVGSRSKVIIVCDSESAIVFKANGGRFRNIELKVEVSVTELSAAKEETENVDFSNTISCIEIDNGEVDIESCTISSQSGSGILIMNRSKVNISNCKIQDCTDVGIWLWDRANADVVNSWIRCCGMDGIRASGESRVHVIQNIIEGNQLHGVSIGDKSKATILQNQIFSNGVDGVRISHECEVNVKENVVSSSLEMGIHVTSTAVSGEIENNKLSDNKYGDSVKCDNEQVIEDGNLLIR